MLLYKLFRSCPGIENIYILVRQKKGKDVHSRVEEIFDDPVSVFFYCIFVLLNAVYIYIIVEGNMQILLFMKNHIFLSKVHVQFSFVDKSMFFF